jgi:single-stranded-DNA-specific exonuclease
MFPEPLFDGRFRLLQQRLVGERHLKVMVEPVGGGPLLDGIAFNVDTSIWPDNGVREVSWPTSSTSMSSAATAACS